MDANDKRRIIEALILASPEPISANRLADLIPYCTPAQAKDQVNELNTQYQDQDRSFEIWEVAGGYQIRTRAEFSGYLQKLRKTRPMRLSRAALEALSIIAYKQPLTRAEIDDVRGVDTGAVVKSLLERRLVRIVGHREVPGRPMLYGTSRRFLEVFGLKTMKDLPELRELEELAREHGLGGPTQDDGAEGSALDAPITELPEGEGPDAAAVAADLGVKEIDPAGLAPDAAPVEAQANEEHVVDLGDEAGGVEHQEDPQEEPHQESHEESRDEAEVVELEGAALEGSDGEAAEVTGDDTEASMAEEPDEEDRNA